MNDLKTIRRTVPDSIGGYVLAGGRSSRMGQDKALLELAGKPLVLRAVQKLGQLCKQVAIAGNRPDLRIYAPVVEDRHPGCGPLSGIEAALAHSCYDWNLFLAVDMPLMPAAWLRVLINQAFISSASATPPVAIVHTVDGREQPLCALYHRDLLIGITQAVREGNCKITRAVHTAIAALAVHRGCTAESLLKNYTYTSQSSSHPGSESPGSEIVVEGKDYSTSLLGEGGALQITAAQTAIRHLWFANINLPEDLDLAAAHADALDS